MYFLSHINRSWEQTEIKKKKKKDVSVFKNVTFGVWWTEKCSQLHFSLVILEKAAQSGKGEYGRGI